MARRAHTAFAGAALPRRSLHGGSRHFAISACATSPETPTIILAPGQGAQIVGMGLAWAEAKSAAKELLAEADAILAPQFPTPLSELMAAGGATLDRTDVAQPALFVAGAMSLLGASGTPIAAGGLSLGEYTALYAAGALSFADGLRLVAARGAAMQAAAEASAGGMVALLGIDETRAHIIAQEAAQGDILVPSNFNAPGQVVLSGAKDAVARAAEIAKKNEFRVAVLDVAGAFHSPMMKPAADVLAEELGKVSFGQLRCSVMSNVTGRPFVEGEIAETLVKGLTSQVRWERCVRYLLDVARESEGTQFVELAPGRTLAGMMRKINRRAKVQSLDAPVEAQSAV